MSDTKSFFVESLDSGFIVTKSGKKSAIAKSQDVEDMIIAELKSMFKFHCSGVSTSSVSISFTENPPKQSKI